MPRMTRVPWTLLLLLRSRPHGPCPLRAAQWAATYAPPSAHCTLTTGSQSGKENKRTVEKLREFSVDVRRIRRVKGWVLLEEETYVEEVASVLRELGADAATVASILERCPEAVVCSPTAVAAQRELWQLVCRGGFRVITLVVSAAGWICCHSQRGRARGPHGPSGPSARPGPGSCRSDTGTRPQGHFAASVLKQERWALCWQRQTPPL
ncbi:transcription termination factor 2, mitochondrial isoform X2 [Heterocephalus glaber]|uniref:Transcription termination factor 2, mitochondrial isoform X2 n=1 Tax=Heterocephalus glaber TaxID=10181 RepID=A0AAX6T235_HETGA|nr:transcription termination factor 2, mitochondrial isoform X2 [Heterocephalus glaber]